MTKQSISYSEKLKKLRLNCAEHQLNGYLVPRADEYQGEFVAPYAERLKWLTGFTGSGGLALVLEDKAFLLTDGRYTLQAQGQVDNDVFEVGDYVQTQTAEWIIKHAPENAVIGYDPALFTVRQIEKLNNRLGKKGITLKAVNENLIDTIWDDQPERPATPIESFPDDIAGATALQKQEKIAQKIKEEGGAAFLFALPDSIAWLLNVRSSDIDYIPSVLSYALIDTQGNVTWFVDPNRVNQRINQSVQCVEPDKITDHLQALAQDADKPVLMDFDYTPIGFKAQLDAAGAGVQHIKDPTIKPKAAKMQTEQSAIRKAHVEDGVALVKFLKWLEEEAQKGELDEVCVVKKLHEFRAQSKFFKGDSFPTICGFGPNGAVIHYRATPETSRKIEGNSLLLIDSGGQYAGGECYGTTDITRTIAIGTPSQEMKENFTRVLKGHIALAQAKFPKGTIGAQVDILARQALWNVGFDYAHGTGHGVGCYLAVHEDAANISARGQTAFEEGMLISNEPGYYKEGEYGIRIENLVFVEKQDEKSLGFETISFAPIDLSCVDVSLLANEEKNWINAYHRNVYEALSLYLQDQENDWMKEKTKPV